MTCVKARHTLPLIIAMQRANATDAQIVRQAIEQAPPISCRVFCKFGAKRP